jgi:hypothetical protein
MSRLRKVLSVSNAVAFLALFVALGGSVYAAGKLSGTQIKPNSLPGNRVKPKTLTAKQVKPGSLTGTQIRAGSLTATQINQSTLTGITASKLGSIQYATVTVALNGGGVTGVANCPAGTNVIGGGATLSNQQLSIVNDSGPTAVRTGWTATGFGEPGVTSMTVTAICTAVGTASG